MDELTDDRIEELRTILSELRDELETTLEGAAEGSRPVSLDQPIGRVSRVDALQQQEMAQANRRNVEIRLAQVRQALSALDSGDYGYCRKCEEPIAYERLRSRPEAPFCVQCQRGSERTGPAR